MCPSQLLCVVVLILQAVFSFRQTNLDGVVSNSPKLPVFTTNGLLDFVIEMIVCEDEVCSFLIYLRLMF